MHDDDGIDVRALVAERARLALQLAAIDRVLDGFGDLRAASSNGSNDLEPRVSPGSALKRGRDRRSKRVVLAIKEAALSEVRRAPGSKTEIFDRLVSGGVVTNTRRDSELILRTLKEYVADGQLTLISGQYNEAPRQRLHSAVDDRWHSDQDTVW